MQYNGREYHFQETADARTGGRAVCRLLSGFSQRRSLRYLTAVPFDLKTSAARIFVAITPPPAVIARLEQFQKGLQAEMGFTAVNWQAPEKAHLTLCFLGPVEATRLHVLEADLLTACLDETPFAIQCSGRGAFPSIRHPKIFWVGLGGELTRLFALQAKIGVTCARFVESSDRYSFSPHVTLATIKTGSPRELNRLSAAYTQAAFEPTSPWPIDGIEIFESHLSPQGARHERIARVAFPG